MSPFTGQKETVETSPIIESFILVKPSPLLFWYRIELVGAPALFIEFPVAIYKSSYMSLL